MDGPLKLLQTGIHTVPDFKSALFIYDWHTIGPEFISKFVFPDARLKGIY